MFVVILMASQTFKDIKMLKIHIVHSNDTDRIRYLVRDDWCPIECSIGGDSIVDDLLMDHHGKYSDLEPVSSRSYRDHYGARRTSRARFVSCGCPDADATFTIAALAGLIPHPNQIVEDVPVFLREQKTKDLTGLAETIGRVDLSPIGLDLTSMDGGDYLLLWNTLMSGQNNDTLGLQTGVGLWRTLLNATQRTLKPLLDAALETVRIRRDGALADLENSEQVGHVLAIKDSTTWGFDVWYSRIEEYPADTIEGWKHPVVIALVANGQNITVGCPNKEVAELLYGPGGLKNIFTTLSPEGWGGREAIGGSPRGSIMTWEQTLEAATVLSKNLL